MRLNKIRITSVGAIENQDHFGWGIRKSGSPKEAYVIKAQGIISRDICAISKMRWPCVGAAGGAEKAAKNAAAPPTAAKDSLSLPKKAPAEKTQKEGKGGAPRRANRAAAKAVRRGRQQPK